MEQITWQSLWEALLEEAAHLCSICTKVPNREMAVAAASIVLARTAWEAFANEFIEQRDLTSSLKNAPVRDKLEGIFAELQASTVPWDSLQIWRDFLIVNEIRNFVTHQKHIARQSTDASERMLTALETAKVIPETGPTISWETRVLRPNVARWSCIVSANAIITLEKIPTKQFRNSAHIYDRVSQALVYLGGGASG